jgi:hypothetical protein
LKLEKVRQYVVQEIIAEYRNGVVSINQH